MHAAVVGGTAITYLILALIHANGATWLVPTQSPQPRLYSLR
jgi:hypothetical protein